MREFLAGGLAAHKIPTRCYRRHELPVTASGKVQKFRLRAELAEASADELA